MSDRASSQKKFFELLEDYRRELLPIIDENWQNLDPIVREKLERLNNFWCNMHVLVHIAESDNISIDLAEKSHYNNEVPIQNASFKKSSESGTVRTIRTACKALSFGGDAKNGCHKRFMDWLKPWMMEKSLTSVPITRFSHNRFNILHHNAAIIFALREKIREFLRIDGSNSWVLYDLEQDFFLAGCKALGLICKLVTTPLWRLIEKKNVHVFDLNSRYLALVKFLKDACLDIPKFMAGDMTPFADIQVKKDFYYDELVKNSEHDADTEAILNVCLPAMTVLLEERFADQLPGGIYDNPSPELRKATTSVPLHNKFSETVFARTDFLLKNKPNVSMLALESYIMFSFNHTTEWLSKKDPVKQKEILEKSYSQVNEVRKQFITRKNKLSVRRAELLKEKLEKQQELKRKREAERLLITQDIAYYGLWQSDEQVDINLSSYPSATQKKEAIKAQLRFRKTILEQSPPDEDQKIYNFSKAVEEGKRKDLTVDELTANLKLLIKAAINTMQSLPPPVDNLVGQKITHRFDDGIWYSGEVVSQVYELPARTKSLQFKCSSSSKVTMLMGCGDHYAN